MADRMGPRLVRRDPATAALRAFSGGAFREERKRRRKKQRKIEYRVVAVVKNWDLQLFGGEILPGGL